MYLNRSFCRQIYRHYLVPVFRLNNIKIKALMQNNEERNKFETARCDVFLSTLLPSWFVYSQICNEMG